MDFDELSSKLHTDPTDAPMVSDLAVSYAVYSSVAPPAFSLLASLATSASPPAEATVFASLDAIPARMGQVVVYTKGRPSCRKGQAIVYTKGRPSCTQRVCHSC